MLLTERHVHLLLLPGMDGTSRLFEPLLAALPATLPATAIAYPTHAPFGYDELLPLILAAIPPGPFVVVTVRRRRAVLNGDGIASEVWSCGCRLFAVSSTDESS